MTIEYSFDGQIITKPTVEEDNETRLDQVKALIQSLHDRGYSFRVLCGVLLGLGFSLDEAFRLLDELAIYPTEEETLELKGPDSSPSPY